MNHGPGFPAGGMPLQNLAWQQGVDHYLDNVKEGLSTNDWASEDWGWRGQIIML